MKDSEAHQVAMALKMAEEVGLTLAQLRSWAQAADEHTGTLREWGLMVSAAYTAKRGDNG